MELCSILNIHSGNCSEDCAFCTQSRFHDTEILRYNLMPADAVIEKALYLEQKGVSRISLVASGRAPSPELFRHVLDSAAKLRRETSLKVCVSLGFITPKQAAALVDAGVSRYHHNLETGRHYYPEICSTHTYDERVETIETARAAGLEICCGGIIGMGERMKDRIDMFSEISSLGAVSVPINVLHAVIGTRLESMQLLPKEEIIASIETAGKICPQAVIRFAGGRSQYDHAFLKECILAGMDGLMTGNYLTTSGHGIEEDLELLGSMGIL